MHYFMASSNESTLGVGTLMRWAADELKSIERTPENPLGGFRLETSDGRIYWAMDIMVLWCNGDEVEEESVEESTDLNSFLKEAVVEPAQQFTNKEAKNAVYEYAFDSCVSASFGDGQNEEYVQGGMHFVGLDNMTDEDLAREAGYNSVAEAEADYDPTTKKLKRLSEED